MTKVPTGVQEGENQQPLYILNPSGDLVQTPETPAEQQNSNGEQPTLQPSETQTPNEAETPNNNLTSAETPQQ
jgi:hypothetical protein